MFPITALMSAARLAEAKSPGNPKSETTDNKGRTYSLSFTFDLRPIAQLFNRLFAWIDSLLSASEPNDLKERVTKQASFATSAPFIVQEVSEKEDALTQELKFDAKFYKLISNAKNVSNSNDDFYVINNGRPLVIEIEGRSNLSTTEKEKIDSLLEGLKSKISESEDKIKQNFTTAFNDSKTLSNDKKSLETKDLIKGINDIKILQKVADSEFVKDELKEEISSVITIVLSKLENAVFDKIQGAMKAAPEEEKLEVVHLARDLAAIIEQNNQKPNFRGALTSLEARVTTDETLRIL